MPITDEHVATLRALLVGDLKRHEELQDRLAPETYAGYATLISAVFFEAVERRFAKNSTRADVINFVADVRTRSESLSETTDPHAAERMILAVYTDETIDELDDRARGALQIVLLAGLIGDEQLSEAELDGVLAKARALGVRLLS